MHRGVVRTGLRRLQRQRRGTAARPAPTPTRALAARAGGPARCPTPSQAARAARAWWRRAARASPTATVRRATAARSTCVRAPRTAERAGCGARRGRAGRARARCLAGPSRRATRPARVATTPTPSAAAAAARRATRPRGRFVPSTTAADRAPSRAPPSSPAPRPGRRTGRARISATTRCPAGAVAVRANPYNGRLRLPGRHDAGGVSYAHGHDLRRHHRLGHRRVRPDGAGRGPRLVGPTRWTTMFPAASVAARPTPSPAVAAARRVSPRRRCGWRWTRLGASSARWCTSAHAEARRAQRRARAEHPTLTHPHGRHTPLRHPARPRRRL
jgi:hypothetical protein